MIHMLTLRFAPTHIQTSLPRSLISLLASSFGSSTLRFPKLNFKIRKKPWVPNHLKLPPSLAFSLSRELSHFPCRPLYSCSLLCLVPLLKSFSQRHQ